MASKPAEVLHLASLEDRLLRICPVDKFKEGPGCRGGNRKRKNLIQLGVDPEHAYQWSRTRMGGWATAQSPILVTTITLERLRKRGYEALLTYYEKIAPHLNEPLYTRTVRTVV
ncbi:MAG: hypothetical protein A2W90_10445 [Bacteroidetes bacterium GWF2_42_66]|nr:MAG: hypothetical protein A2W92_24140 [Bacteroidetes bacterium GWA2_42_15]OFY01490.1 MAG: hypothetical protein A2W89_02070 [Bacteroidetes bacterium GWE2_42_39]OFY43329.1 MAG: hypothetical protein A2W90_10445 [Bacteroidetes bacterium GWF2_42_66]